MMLCNPGWESASLYQTTSSTQGEVFIAGERILPHYPVFIMLCLKQGWNGNVVLAVGCFRSWSLVVVSFWILGQHCSWAGCSRAKQDLVVPFLNLSSAGILIRRPSASSLLLCFLERMFHLLAEITPLVFCCLFLSCYLCLSAFCSSWCCCLCTCDLFFTEGDLTGFMSLCVVLISLLLVCSG